MAAESATETARGAVERIEPSKAQRAAARRIAESKATAPHFYLEADVRTPRAPLAAVMRAVAKALREFPRVNGAYRDGAFETYSRVNVGVVMEGSDALVIPTVFDADRKSTAEIEAELDRLAGLAAAGSLASPDLAGGTFTLAPLDVGSIRSHAAVLNQGQAAALALGPVTERAVARDGTVRAERALTATLSCDGRMLTPDEGARFLQRVAELLETPE